MLGCRSTPQREDAKKEATNKINMLCRNWGKQKMKETQNPKERDAEPSIQYPAHGPSYYGPIRTLCCCLCCRQYPLLFLIAQGALAAAEVYAALARRNPCNAFGLVALMHVRETALHLDCLGAYSKRNTVEK